MSFFLYVKFIVKRGFKLEKIMFTIGPNFFSGHPLDIDRYRDSVNKFLTAPP